MADYDYLQSTCVLATTNAETMEINDYVTFLSWKIKFTLIFQVLDKLLSPRTEVMEIQAIDTPSDGLDIQVPPEYFSNCMETGMPPFKLRVKVK